MQPRIPRWTMAALVALVLAVPATAQAPSVPVEVEVGADARAMMDASDRVVANLSANSTRAELEAAKDALLDVYGVADAKVRVGDLTLYEGDVVRHHVQEHLDAVFWRLILLDVKADPVAAFDTAYGKVREAEETLDVDVTERGARQARHHLRHALGLVTAIEIVAKDQVDADALAELAARIRVDLDRTDEAEGAAAACDCPIRLELRTAVNVAVATAKASVQAAKEFVVDVIG